MQDLFVKSWAVRPYGLLEGNEGKQNEFTRSELEWKFLPAALKRRSSKLTKYALEVAFEVSADENVDCAIFGSQHGELTRTVQLMGSIAKSEILSPISFSQSVHNTAVGLYAIQKKSNLKTTSMAAGSQTVKMTLMEASAYLAKNPEHLVLIVLFDEGMPEVYQDRYGEVTFDFSLGLLVGAKNSPGLVKIDWQDAFEGIDGNINQALELVRRLAGG